MKKNIMISLVSIQWQNNEKSETELLTKAKFSHENGFDVISYEDTSATGFEGSVTIIKLEGEKSASIIRRGTRRQACALLAGCQS